MGAPDALACLCVCPDAVEAAGGLPASLAWIVDNVDGAPAAPEHGADA
jgi:hypothetical protein